MTLFEQTLQEFASSLGMEQVQMSGDSQSRSLFQIQNIGLLQLEYLGHSQEKVAVSLSVSADRIQEAEIRRIFQETHYRQKTDFPVNAFVGQQGTLTFSAVLNAYDFTLPNLHQCLERLSQLMDQLNPYLRLSR